MKDNKSFGEVIRQLREERGLLLRQVAALLDVDSAFLSKMERSEKKANGDHVEKLSKILEVDESKLRTIWLSDKLMQTLKQEPQAYNALQLTQKRLRTKNI